MLADPAARKLLVRSLIGTVLPIEGGACTSAGDISNAAAFGANCAGGDFSFPAKLGIGTPGPPAPAYSLDIVKAAPNERLKNSGGAGFTVDSVKSGLEGGATERGFATRYYDNPTNYLSLVARSAHFVLGADGNTFVFGKSTGTERLGLDNSFTQWATITSSKLTVGSNSGQTAALIVARNAGSNIEFGHYNPAGYGSAIGAELSSGKPYIAFNAESGTNLDLYRTRGIAGTVIRGTLNGGLDISAITNVNADNQTPTTRLTIDGSGNVGIGTPSPAEKLDVAGNVKCDALNKIIFLRPRGPGLNDAAQINAAIAGLATTNGGIIMLQPGEYRIDATISITNNGVKVRGYGGNWPSNIMFTYPAGDPVPGGSDVPATKLLWVGAAGGTVLNLTPSGGGTNLLRDVEISDLTVHGNDSAGMGLLLTNTITSKFISLHIRSMQDLGGTGIKLTTSAWDANVTTSWNMFLNCSVMEASKGVVLSGAATPPGMLPGSNPAHNSFDGLTIRFRGSSDDDAGILLENSDNNLFVRVGMGRSSKLGKRGNSVRSQNDDGFGHAVARANYFYHLQVQAPPPNADEFKVTRADVIPGNKTIILGYDRENGQEPPVAVKGNGSAANPADFLFWTDSRGGMNSTGNADFEVFRKTTDEQLSVVIQPGLNSEQVGRISFRNRAGAEKWAIDKNASDQFIIGEPAGQRLVLAQAGASAYRTGSTTSDHSFQDAAGSVEFLRVSGTALADNDTVLLVRYKPGAGAAIIGRVTVGGPDSCGTGFRCLRVPN